ncbi:MAG TPA: MFS transporter [Burkholderiales bacterium]|nr:MFS transporter [Burkholderiales bacterium]
MQNPPRLDLFLNVGHFFDHLAMLIFPTAVLAIGAAWQRPYSELLPLALGGFIAFGACSIPAGWLADHWSRRGMMVLFFFGIGAATVATGLARTSVELAVGLTAIGVFGAIYHPVGIAMLVSNQPQLGRTLGVNGVWGNAGLAFAALLTGALADFAGWRAAFFVPGALCIAAGFGFLWASRGLMLGKGAAKKGEARLPRALLARIFLIVAVATACGGLIFNATTVSMPKVFDERLSALTDTNLGIGALVCATYLIAAMAQLIVGRWIDRRSIKAVFVGVAALQVPLLFAAGSLAGYGMLLVAVAMMFFVFGQIPINDAMIARYTAEEWRARAYAVRYVVSFAASATAVPLIVWVHRTYGDFQPLFAILAAVAVLTLVASLAFPGERIARPVPA